MSPHVDILDQSDRLAPSFFGSLAFHGLLVAAIAGIGWVQSRNTISLGDPNGGRLGAVTVNPVSTISLPSHAGAKNPVATDTESAVPVPITKAKPAPKVKAPDPKADPHSQPHGQDRGPRKPPRRRTSGAPRRRICPTSSTAPRARA